MRTKLSRKPNSSIAVPVFEMLMSEYRGSSFYVIAEQDQQRARATKAC